jgi:alpha-mannosidase
MAKKKAKFSTVTFIITNERENEDINYAIDWIKVIIQGTPEQEQEEFEEANRLYTNFGKLIKKDFAVENADSMKQHFKTKMLNLTELSDAYKQGYGSVQDTSISQKLLEMGILTHIKLLKDYDSREVNIKADIGTFENTVKQHE